MKKLRFLAILLLFICSCKKEKNLSGIPLVTVDIYIYSNDPAFVDVSIPGGWEYINGGSRGILLYRLTTDEFMAFDRHCTYEPSNTCARVFVDATNIMAVDTCCGSEFLITDGSVIKNPASFPLKQYRTDFDGSVLHIFN